jgi:hypothetical protein
MRKYKLLKYLLIVLFYAFTLNSFGQMLDPGDPGGDPVGNDPLGGGAPIGSGIVILLSLGTIYGGKKMLDIRKEYKIKGV